MTTFMSTFSYINQKHPYLLTLGALVITMGMLFVFGWFSHVMTSFLEAKPLAHYGATFVMTFLLVLLTFALAVHFNNPKRRK